MGTLSKRRYRGIGKSPKRATKNLPALKNLKYCDRFEACKLTSLHYRRLRGDMIETYKIVTGKYDPVLARTTLSRSVSYITRGNNLRLQKHHTRYDLRKYNFNNRVVSLWIVCLTGLWCLITLTYSRIDWTAFGKVKILFMTLEHNCMEPEVDLRYVLSNVIE